MRAAVVGLSLLLLGAVVAAPDFSVALSRKKMVSVWVWARA